MLQFTAAHTALREQILANASILLPAQDREVIVFRDRAYSFGAGDERVAAIIAELVHKLASRNDPSFTVFRTRQFPEQNDSLGGVLYELLANAKVLDPGYNVEIIMGRENGGGSDGGAVYAAVVHRPASQNEAPLVLMRGDRITHGLHTEYADALHCLLQRTMTLIDKKLTKADAAEAVETMDLVSESPAKADADEAVETVE